MNIDECYAVYTSLSMTIEDCLFPKDLERLVKLRIELGKVISMYNKIGYTENLVNKYMAIKRELLKLGAI